MLFLPLDTDVHSLGTFLEVSLSSFDILNRTTEDLATILALDWTRPEDIKNYTFLQLIDDLLCWRRLYPSLGTSLGFPTCHLAGNY